MILYMCPDCGSKLELYANGDEGPQDDRWTCEACCIEYPHSVFPLPADYVRNARAVEKAEARKQAQKAEMERLIAWNLEMLGIN